MPRKKYILYTSHILYTHFIRELKNLFLMDLDLLPKLIAPLKEPSVFEVARYLTNRPRTLL